MTLPVVFTANGPSGYNLTKSLRFRSSASAYLNRTFASAGNQKTWTMSFWVKRGRITSATTQEILGCYSSSSDTGNFEFRFTTSDTLQCYLWNGGTTTNAVFRDPSAWYHVVLVIDTTQAGTSSGSKIKMYVNNVLQTFSSDYISGISQNTNLIWNATTAEYIGRWYASDGGTYYPDVYLSEMNFIDGQALTPSSFGETSTTTGVWQPKKYTGTYGTNGFYLPFTDVATTSGSNAGLGKDFSGNGNYWNTNNISVTSGSTYDSMTDVPTQAEISGNGNSNYCTLNPLASRSVGTMQNGNLTWKKSDAAADNYCCASSFSIPSSGKWYWEVTVTDGASGANSIGVIPSTSTTQQTANTIPGDFGITTNAFGYYSDGNKLNAGSSASYGNSFTSGDVIAVAVDTTNGKIWWSKNGTWQASGDPAAGTNAAFTTLSGSYYAASSVRFNGNQHDYNFGQRPFAYTPPTGFVALNTFNLPTPTIGATASSQADNYFNAVTYTGTSGTQAVTGVGFQPDFVWIKNRTSTLSHVLQDAVRGTTAYLVSNATTAENTNTASNWFRSFDSDGFTVATLTSPGGVSTNEWNNTGYNYVSWNWRASNATAVTNTAGSITSTVSANTTAGFSIVTYTGTGVTGTIGHGLGVAPAMIIVKSRSNASNWYTYHQSIGNTGAVALNLTNATITSANFWNNTSPTSSVFTASAGSAEINGNGLTYVAYCFAPIAGYSAFGSYTGNGSTDGTFVYTGFRPKFVLMKATTGSNNWIIYDTVRNTYNLTNLSLVPDSSAAENGVSTTTENTLDILSNGFKLRTSNALTNGSSVPYIYACFAENPFKYANAR